MSDQDEFTNTIRLLLFGEDDEDKIADIEIADHSPI